jgi:uncharacterized protein involved in type VI secretion and phage assembly
MEHSLGFQNLHLAKVLENQDSQGRGRIQVRLMVNQLDIWASCMSNSAGQNYGISFLPRKDEMVVVAFFRPDEAIVLGSVWSGSNSHPTDAQAVEDIYAMVTPGGTKLIMDESSSPKVTIETPAGHTITIDDSGAGEITIDRSGDQVKLSADGISITSSVKVKIEASQVDVSAAMVKVDAAMSQFSGVVKCDTLIATSVVGTTYTPGAGNVW